MIFLVGDTHGTHDIYKLEKLSKQVKLTKDDYVIILGDAGIVWSSYTLQHHIDRYEAFPFTTLFIDGNHENFDMLDSYEVRTWSNGKVHFISDSIIHLMRGQIFNINGFSFLTFGGAKSIDKHFRTEGISWWSQEQPNEVEFNKAILNLQKHGNKIDYILTHTIDKISMLKHPLSLYKYTPFETSQMLDFFETNINYKHWYCGHFHVDIKINEKKTVLYNSIVLIE